MITNYNKYELFLVTKTKELRRVGPQSKHYNTTVI